jgi:hypothetical protein
MSRLVCWGAWCPHFHLHCNQASGQVEWRLYGLPGGHFPWMGIYPNQTHFILVPLQGTLTLITFNFLTAETAD